MIDMVVLRGCFRLEADDHSSHVDAASDPLQTFAYSDSAAT
jgi:hypothetical protein